MNNLLLLPGRRPWLAKTKRWWTALLLAAVLAEAAQAATPVLGTVLAPNGTVRRGAHGSFDARGYTMRPAPDGRPVFRLAAPQRVLGPAGAGDSNWSDAFQANGPDGPLRALAVDGRGNVYVGGLFATAGGVPANNVAKWNGTAWSALGAGTNNYVYALALDGAGNLYAGGRFSQAGGVSTYGTAKWNGASWAALNSSANGFVFALALDGAGSLYAGGNFTQIDGVPANGVAKWNGTAWAGLGTGINGPNPFNTVFALVLDGGGNLYAGGTFATAGGLAVNNVAQWNGTAWAALGTGIDGGTNGVNALALDGTGNLYAGGYFTVAGGAPAGNIARWNGTAWAGLGTGVGGTNPLSTVRALDVTGAGTLYVGGEFATAGGLALSNVAAWNGTAWAALGTGANGFVAALAPTGGGLYAGGNFTAVGDGSKTMTRLGFYARSALAAAAARPPLALRLFPNPARATATVQLPAVPGATEATVALVNALGRVVRTQRVRLAAGETTAELSLSGVRPGLYQLRVAAGGRQASRTLVVE